jgi:hypothetical protein
MKKILTLFAAAMLITACSNEDGTTTPDGQQTAQSPITFDVTDNGSLTRAQGDITSSNFQTKRFGVFASYTGTLKYENTTVSPDFMYNQPVSYAGGGWSYAPTKYWPNDAAEYVSFFAYAPYEESPADDGRCIIDMSKWDDKGDPWVNYRLAQDPFNDAAVLHPQVDLLYAVNEGASAEVTDDTPWLDQQKPDINARVKFTFKHALACVGDKITMKLTESLAQKLNNYAELTINSVKIDYKNLTNKARLVLKCSNMPEWREIVSGQLTVSRTLTIASPTLSGTTETTISEGKGLFYIPLQVAGTEAPVAEVTLNYTVKILGTGTVMSGTGTGTFALSLDTMEGKKQAINLNLGENIDMRHLIYQLDNDPADEPSYAPKF